MAYTEAQNRATQKYIKENLETVSFRVKKGERDKLKAYAESVGMSYTQFIIEAVNAHAGKQVITPSK